MKNLSRLILLLTIVSPGLVWSLHAESGPGQPPQQNQQVNLKGEWENASDSITLGGGTDVSLIADRGLRMLITDGTNVRAIFIQKEQDGSYQPDCKLVGGKRDHFFEGQLQGTNLTGKIIVCAINKQLIDDCPQFSSVYETTFKATVVQGWRIEGTYFREGVAYDTKNGHFVNCRRDDHYSSNPLFKLWLECRFSGLDWVKEYPTSTSTDDLAQPFQDNVNKFIAELQAVDPNTHQPRANVDISATVRPAERSYLMHYAWHIAHNLIDPSKVPWYYVNICWVHRDANGNFDLPASKAAAQQMIGPVAQGGYGMNHDAFFDESTHIFESSYEQIFSRHNRSNAIDMTISWTGDLTIKDGNGNQVPPITSTPRNGDNLDLQAVGATYGVHKVNDPTDPEHWSNDGH